MIMYLFYINIINYFIKNMLFNYLISYRITCFILIFCCSFTTSFFGIKLLINLLKKHNKFQPIRKDGVETHLLKAKTPTMGGLAFGLGIVINTLLFCNLNLQTTWILLFIVVGFGIVGLIDDIIKVFFNDVIGFKGYIKLMLEFVIASISLLWLANYNANFLNTNILIPFFNVWFDFAIFAFPLLVIAMVGSSNATNITDGLDGLLTIPVLFICSSFICIILFENNHIINNVLNNVEIFNLINFLIIIISSFCAFFYWNRHPAQIFMGDVGSLMIGAVLFFISFLLKIELFYAVMALLFIVELASSFLQVLIYKITKKRIFKMAPIHHHFEKCGWSESKVVLSFWGFSLFCCLIILFFLVI